MPVRSPILVATKCSEESWFPDDSVDVYDFCEFFLGDSGHRIPSVANSCDRCAIFDYTIVQPGCVLHPFRPSVVLSMRGCAAHGSASIRRLDRAIVSVRAGVWIYDGILAGVTYYRFPSE